MGYVTYEQQGYVGVLTICRPEALNALNDAVMTELSARLDAIGDSDMRCLIITGAGEKAFVAGADIGEMLNLSRQEAVVFSRRGSAVMDSIERLPVPVIAAVNGYALGGGCELALACDIRIASERAVFALPEVSLGIMPGYGGIQRLARLMSMAKVKELVFTADRVKAPEALALGLVNAVVPPEQLMEYSMAMAQRIAANAPLGVRLAKGVANACVGLSLDECAYFECEPFGRCFETADQRGAMAAFIDKRKPPAFAGK